MFNIFEAYIIFDAAIKVQSRNRKQMACNEYNIIYEWHRMNFW